jgi:hypothetical protein
VEEVDVDGRIILKCILNVSFDDSGPVEDMVDCVHSCKFKAYTEQWSTFEKALLEYHVTDEKFCS